MIFNKVLLKFRAKILNRVNKTILKKNILIIAKKPFN